LVTAITGFVALGGILAGLGFIPSAGLGFLAVGLLGLVFMVGVIAWSSGHRR
jgi:hypothetical protein